MVTQGSEALSFIHLFINLQVLVLCVVGWPSSLLPFLGFPSGHFSQVIITFSFLGLAAILEGSKHVSMTNRCIMTFRPRVWQILGPQY